DGQRGPVGSWRPAVIAAKQPVDHLVDGAVAAEDDDEVITLVGGAGAELDGVAASLGLGHIQLEVAAEGAGEDVAAAGRRRGRLGIDDEQGPHLSRVAVDTLPSR